MERMAKHSTRMSGDQMRRTAMWILASGVAAIAAVVSYAHIYDLGRAHGGTGVAARLLPLSVDALILVGELMLLHEADTKGRRFALGWVLVWSGILATLAANVTYGAQFGLEGAVIWGWPAYSFILAAAGMVSVVKRTSLAPAEAPEAGTPAPEPAALAPVPVVPQKPIPIPDTDGDTRTPGTSATRTPRKAATVTRKPARSKTASAAPKPAVPSDVDTQALALAIIAEHPDISGSELGRRLGVHPSRGRQLKQRLTGPVAGPDSKPAAAALNGQDPES